MKNLTKSLASSRWPTKRSSRRTIRRVLLGVALVGATLSLGLLGAAIAAINPTAPPKCGANETYAIDVKDWTTTKFRDGVHVLASLKTPRGNFEFRLTTKGGVPVAEPDWFLNNSALKEIDRDKLPLDAQKCIAATTTNYERLIQTAKVVLSFVETPVYAACKSAAGRHVFKVVYVADEGGGPVYVLEETVNGRFCRYVVV